MFVGYYWCTSETGVMTRTPSTTNNNNKTILNDISDEKRGKSAQNQGRAAIKSYYWLVERGRTQPHKVSK